LCEDGKVCTLIHDEDFENERIPEWVLKKIVETNKRKNMISGIK